MAPTDLRHTRVYLNFGNLQYANPIAIIQPDFYYSNNCYVYERKKEETKKQRTARIAKEKMLASWDVHNKKSPTVKERIQICKPRHQITSMGFRKR